MSIEKKVRTTLLLSSGKSKVLFDDIYLLYIAMAQNIANNIKKQLNKYNQFTANSDVP